MLQNSSLRGSLCALFAQLSLYPLRLALQIADLHSSQSG